MSSRFEYLLKMMKTIYQDRYQLLIEVLIEIRKDRGLTQAQLANKLDKPQSYIAKIEAKDRKLDVLEFVILCETLVVSPCDVLQVILDDL